MTISAETTWKVVYLIAILIVTFIGNILVIMVVYRSRRNQWTTNHFVVSLAIVNLFTATVYLAFNIDSIFRNHWLFGNVECKINSFLVHFNALSSVGILCCMSFDRYYLTAYPLTFKLSKAQTKKVILAVWILATSIACPMVFFYEIQSASCQPEFSEKWSAYFSCFSLLFLLPHFATYVTYFKVYHCIRARNNSVNGSRFVQKVPRTKIKVTKLLVAQLIIYTVLWVPYIIYQCITMTTSIDCNQTILQSLSFLSYASSASSPLIYSIISADFRRGCKLILMRYDASMAYRIPAQLERKNKVNISDNFPSPSQAGKTDCSNLSRPESEVEPANGLTFFEQPRVAWSDV